MRNSPEKSEDSGIFPEFIGQDAELWQKYYDTYGQEAYKYRRLYEEAARQLTNLYIYAEENDLDIPDAGPSFT